MNKKLIATAMGLVLAGGMGLASADVKIGGQLDMSIDATDVDGGEDDVNMGSNRSSIWFKGKEDLGNGLSAFFKSDWQVDLDDAGTTPGTNEDDTNEDPDKADGWKARDQIIGFKGGFGKIGFGMQSTAYKSPGSKLDPFYRTRNQARNIGLQSTLHKGRGEEGQGRATNTVRYDTPKMNGFGGTVTYTLDNNKGDGEDDDPYSVGVTYKGGGAFVFASYMTTDQGGDDDVWQVGGKYKFGDAAVWGIYEADGGLITSTGMGADDGADIWSVGGSYTIGNNLVSLDYGQGDENNVRVEYDTWRLGAKHNFSKRTNVYITHSNQDFDVSGGGEIDITSVGMRHNF